MDIRKCLSVLVLALLLVFSPACGSLAILVKPARTVELTPSATPSPAPTPLPKPYRHNIGEARSQMNAWLVEHQPEFSMTADGVLETDFGISDLYDRTSTQFYKFDPYLFALYGDSTQRFVCRSILMADTADVDADGQAELVLLCEVGSGRFIYELIVVKAGVPHVRVVANSGSGIQFRLCKQSDNSLYLVRTILENGKPVSELNLGRIALIYGDINLFEP